MNQQKLRIIVLCLWASSLVLGVAMVLAAPLLIRDGSLDAAQVMGLLPGAIGLFLPALSCLAGFWFSTQERKRATTGVVARDRCLAGLVLTCVYLALALAMIAWPIYVASYPLVLDLAATDQLEARFSAATKVALMLSPLALAPINFLTSQ